MIKKFFVFVLLLCGVSCAGATIEFNQSIGIEIGSGEDTEETPIIEKYQTCRTGDTLVIAPNLSEFVIVDSVRYCWDDRYLETQKSMPFVCKYILESQALGAHIMECDIFHRAEKTDQVSTMSICLLEVIIEP